jgi:2-keto-4-pentenoate hydratase/2-oxohepta-3-ene-1,7-dioic acid hydratase in catechol pathway
MDFEPDIRFDINNYSPGKIVCVGMNYKSHISEQDGRFPSKPVLFAKAISSIIKDGENIFYPPEVKELDYEVELAVIIGSKMKDISEKDVLSYIYG